MSAIEIQACGFEDERILATYPTLTREHLRAASSCAADFWGVYLNDEVSTER